MGQTERAPLTSRQARFVAEYLIDSNATQAAIRAGYSARSAAEQGYDNLRKPQIAAAIAAGKARQLADAGLTAARVLEALGRVAFSDISMFWRPDGMVRIRPSSRRPSAVVSPVSRW